MLFYATSKYLVTKLQQNSALPSMLSYQHRDIHLCNVRVTNVYDIYYFVQ